MLLSANGSYTKCLATRWMVRAEAAQARCCFARQRSLVMELTNKSKTCVSVVTPTLRRAQEVHELLQNLGAQTLRPLEFILVDGAPEGEEETRHIAEAEFPHAPFSCRYLR